MDGEGGAGALVGEIEDGGAGVEAVDGGVVPVGGEGGGEVEGVGWDLDVDAEEAAEGGDDDHGGGPELMAGAAAEGGRRSRRRGARLRLRGPGRW